MTAVTIGMSFTRGRPAHWLIPLLAFSVHCGDSASGDLSPNNGGGNPSGADSGEPGVGSGDVTDAGGDVPSAAPSIEMRVTTPSQLPTNLRAEFRPGAAWGSGLASLKYLIRGVQVCESLEAMGSGFNNPQGCLTLYDGDENALPYNLTDDFTPLGDRARALTTGYIDLLDPSSRAGLASSREITRMDVRSYNYGIITWALPIKFTATVRLSDGSNIYSHDGVSRSQLVGTDNYRDYFTQPSTALDQASAEEAVVLLPNGGNWFKFQSPMVIAQDDIDNRRAFVLDLVFNPDGIVKGYAGEGAYGQLRELDSNGQVTRAMTVPMLDLAPVPHRKDELVVRESYQGAIALGSDSFDARIELYYVEGDTTGTVYGVDVKALVNSSTHRVTPELSKVSYLERADDGSLSFLSFSRAPIITGLVRATEEGAVTRAVFKCSEYSDRAGAEGGSAFVVEHCPSPTVSVDLTLRARSRVQGGVPAGIGAGPDDAGVAMDGSTDPDASADGSASDAGVDGGAAAGPDASSTDGSAGPDGSPDGGSDGSTDAGSDTGSDAAATDAGADAANNG